MPTKRSVVTLTPDERGQLEVLTKAGKRSARTVTRACILLLPGVWTSPAVQDALTATLSFLSEAEYTFEFSHTRRDHSLDGFINYDKTPFHGRVEDVVMFSGGLDSLAGAVKEAVEDRRQILLVNHRPTEKPTWRDTALLRQLARHAGDRAPLHFPIRVNKVKRLGKEFTQRTRSFLFAALGTTFARMIGLNRLRFYENGVVSLNLPPSAQMVGARASRTCGRSSPTPGRRSGPRRGIRGRRS
jgi:hypothetical protein